MRMTIYHIRTRSTNTSSNAKMSTGKIFASTDERTRRRNNFFHLPLLVMSAYPHLVGWRLSRSCCRRRRWPTQSQYWYHNLRNSNPRKVLWGNHRQRPRRPSFSSRMVTVSAEPLVATTLVPFAPIRATRIAATMALRPRAALRKFISEKRARRGVAVTGA